ncbi:MAG: hypothetical protein ACO1RX_07445 [Candidatus Sericytochromatia bacterium]
MGNPITQPAPYTPLPTPGVQPVTTTTPTETSTGVPVTPTPVATEVAPPVDQTDVRQRAAADFHPTNDKILFLGINPSATPEAAALRRSAGAGNVTEITDRPNGVLDGHDLNTDAGIDSFVASLGLPEATQTEMGTFLRDLSPEVRDEYAQIAKAWAPGERGEAVPSRLVLSGHSNGDALFSEVDRGTISFDDIGRMARMMPQAAAQVEDVHISGCNSGFRVNSEIFKQHFPNLKTFWAYSGTAPSAGTGSGAHLRRWETSTRGRVDALDREQASRNLGLRAPTVAVWSERNGYQANPSTVDSERNEQDLVDTTKAYLDGTLDLPRTPHAGPVFDLYNQMQARHGNLPADSPERERSAALIDRTLKLRFYGTVSDNFQKTFGPSMAESYKELGLPAPDFSRLNRREALAEIEKFNDAFYSRYRSKQGPQVDPPPALEQTRLQLQAFRDLSPALMNQEWIEPFGADRIERARTQAQGLTREAISRNYLAGPEESMIQRLQSIGWNTGGGNAGGATSPGEAAPADRLTPAETLPAPTQADYDAAIEELRTRMEALRARRPAN